MLSWLFIVLAHGHIILIPSKPVFTRSPYCCVLRGETGNTNFIALVWPDRVCSKNNMAGATSWTDQNCLPFGETCAIPRFLVRVNVTECLVFCEVLCGSFFVPASFCCWLLYYLSFELRPPITPALWNLQTFPIK